MKLKTLITTAICVGLLVSAQPNVMASELTENNVSAVFIDEIQLATLKTQLEDAEEKMEHAHTMAESARELGLEEDSETIELAKNYWVEANAKREELEEAINSYEVKHYFTYNVFEKTNISAKGYDYLLLNTPLAGMGQSFEDMEQTYGVNGLFAISVARTESGLGVSKLAINKNNYFGMLGCSFKTPHEGIMYFGELMNKGYYKDKDIESIAKTYCPPTWQNWAAQNKMFMQQYWDKLLSYIP